MPSHPKIQENPLRAGPGVPPEGIGKGPLSLFHTACRRQEDMSPSEGGSNPPLSQPRHGLKDRPPSVGKRPPGNLLQYRPPADIRPGRRQASGGFLNLSPLRSGGSL